MTSKSPVRPQQQQQQQQQQYQDAQMVNLDYLTNAERQLIIAVLDRDAAIRQKEQTRINQIKRDMRELRMRGVIRGNHDDASKKCARCCKKFIWLINTARVCVQCSHRVCDRCSQQLPQKRWMCSLCLKQLCPCHPCIRELVESRGILRHQFADDNPSTLRKHATLLPSSDY